VFVDVDVLVGVFVGVFVSVMVGVLVAVFVLVVVAVFVAVLVVQPSTERVTELDVTGLWPLATIMESLTTVLPGAVQPTVPHQETAPAAP
jgi:hypothetical protein